LIAIQINVVVVSKCEFHIGSSLAMVSIKRVENVLVF